MPATPIWSLVMAPRIPAVRVPCQLLLVTVQPENCEVLASAAVTQSPGSEASESRPPPSLETATLEIML
jgi:hypothetical protein